jgi:hypothetical protein
MTIKHIFEGLRTDQMQQFRMKYKLYAWLLIQLLTAHNLSSHCYCSPVRWLRSECSFNRMSMMLSSRKSVLLPVVRLLTVERCHLSLAEFNTQI